MTAAELFLSLRALPRSEKIQLLQWLASDLASEEGENPDETVTLLPTDQCPYTPSELARMRNEPEGRTLAQIYRSRGMT